MARRISKLDFLEFHELDENRDSNDIEKSQELWKKHDKLYAKIKRMEKAISCDD